MATYTLSILDILQENAGGSTLDPLDPAMLTNMEQIAKDSIFGPHTSLIEEKHRSAFIQGFCMNFLYDEIGIETLTGWRMALVGRLLNNADYINGIFDTVDKQIFSNFSTRRITTDGTENRSDSSIEAGTSTGSETATTTDEGTSTSEATTLGDQDTTIDTTVEGTNSDNTSGTTGVTEGGTSSTKLTGGETTTLDTKTSSQGTGSEKLSGTDSTTQSGSDSVRRELDTSINHGKKEKRGGSLTDTYQDYEVANSGTVSDDGNSTLSFNGRETATDNDTLLKNSTTPQDGLSGLRDDKYLTSAQMTEEGGKVSQAGSESTDTDNTRKDNTKQTTSGSVEHADSTSTSASGTDKTSETGLESTTRGTVEDLKHGRNTATTSSSSDTNTGTTEVEQDSTSTETRDFTTDTTNESESSGTTSDKTTGTTGVHNDSTTTTTGSTTGDGTSTRETEGSNDRSVESDGDTTRNEESQEESYDLNYEMLAAAQPLLNKVWSVFDDLFLQIL